ncbi:uncharacterized protein ISCGN_021446, partial [Ixodes scapularis]
ELIELVGPTNVLGVGWETRTDMIKVDLTSLINFLCSREDSKRFVLQASSRIFDPMGLLAPAIITVKILFQQLWERGVDWDETLPADLYEEWDAWCKDLTALKNIAVPRLIALDFSKDETEKALHVFCDASTRAYGAVAYLTSKEQNGKRVALIMAKSRVAPLKWLTLPRLQLMGALIGARLTQFLTSKLKLEGLPVYLWTDSAIVLYWIRGSTTRWKLFVANRVTEIQALTEPRNWRHCPGTENPADLLTRGLMPKSLVQSKTWWNGPIWLHRSETSWPSQIQGKPEGNEYLAEEKKETIIQLTVPQDNQLVSLEDYSSFIKLIRGTAWIKRFTNNVKHQGQRSGLLTSEEIIEAEKFWIKTIQNETFSIEIKLLRDQRQVQKTSKIKMLNPNIDCDGI